VLEIVQMESVRAPSAETKRPAQSAEFGSISYAHYLANAAARLPERLASSAALNVSTPPSDTRLR
jgi:hypothetical protein